MKIISSDIKDEKYPVPHSVLIQYSRNNNQSIYETISGLKMARLKYDGKYIIDVRKTIYE